MRWPSVSAALLAVLIGSASGAASAAQEQTAEPQSAQAGSALLPPLHPARAVLAHLYSASGFDLGREPGPPWPVTRDDFAAASMQMFHSLKGAVELISAELALPAGERTLAALHPPLLATFKDSRLLARDIACCSALLVEFEAELRSAGQTPDQLGRAHRQLRLWRDGAPAYAASVRRALRDEGAAPPPPGPFTDHPGKNFAYVIVAYIAGKGIFTGYPDGTFSGKRLLTRYEFAVAVQRMHVDLARAAANVAAPGGGGAAPVGGNARSPLLLRQLLTWLEPMTAEFAPDLESLGGNPEMLWEQNHRLQEALLARIESA